MAEIKFKKWLDKLQEDSWHIELIITGFSLFGLVNLLDFLSDKIIEVRHLQNPQTVLVYIWIKTAAWVLIFNLCIHVIARGLWVGCLGLRSVSGEIDFKALNYSPKFTSFLEKKVGSFDRYILRLENFCSSLFAITFLLLFYLISLFIFIIILVQISSLIEGENVYLSNALKTILIVLFVGAIINLIDFFGVGWLKKRKWTSKLYFPVYRFFSLVTLSFLYRPLIYNLLDHKQGRRISAMLVPVYLIIFIISGYNYKASSFLANYEKTTHNFINFENYEDQLEGKKFASNLLIPSKVIEKPYLDVFYRFKDNIEDTLVKYNAFLDSLKTSKNLKRGYASTWINISVNPLKEDEKIKILDEYLQTFNELYALKINDSFVETRFVLTKKQNKQLGFQAVLPIQHLKAGAQLLTLYFQPQSINQKEKLLITLPFWYYPNP